MKIVQVNVNALKPAEYNPRAWTEKDMQDVKESLRRFGFVDPLIVNSAPKRKNIVIGGHFRLEAAKELGFTDVPVVYVDIPDKDKERELNLRLNKNTGHWDEKLLANFDRDFLKDVGFDVIELENIFSTPLHEDDFDAQAEYEKIEKVTIKQGDVYKLGSHRLICGDAIKRETFESLFQGDKADLIFTDPPYNVNYNYNVRYFDGRKKRKGVKWEPLFNDNKPKKEFTEFLCKSFQNAHVFSEDSVCLYCWYATKTDNEFRDGLKQAGWHISQVLIWLKEHIVFSNGQDYHRIYEPCFFGWKKGKKHFTNKTHATWSELIQLDFETFLDQLDVMYQKRDNAKLYEHPTQKPVRLAERALKKHSLRDQIVLDMFGGSGSTLIACEQVKRRCYMIELDPKFCQVIINRWERFIGKKAEKI